MLHLDYQDSIFTLSKYILDTQNLHSSVIDDLSSSVEM